MSFASARSWFSEELMSDEKLLWILREERAKSRYIPIKARAESETWLAKHTGSK
jgi:hypothetical protein